MLVALLKDLALSNSAIQTAIPESPTFKVNLGLTFAHFLHVFGEQYSTQHFCIDENNDFVENQNLHQMTGLFSTINP